MMLSKRTLGYTAAGLVLLVLASGAYFRITGADEEGGEAGDEVNTEGVISSATETFSTDVPIPVEGAVVVRDTLIRSVTASGEATAARKVVITAQVAGRIRRLPARESERVREGELLVGLNAAEYRLGLKEAKARLEAARASYRKLTLFNDRIEDSDVRAAREEAARAKSGLAAAKVAVERAKLKLARTRIRAPFAGRVASVKVVPGEWVGPGTKLMTLLDLHPIEVEVQVLESEVGYLEPGGEATVYFAAFPDRPFTGEIVSINPLVRSDTRTATVVVRVPNPEGEILPGMYARVALDAREFPHRILVPRAAILERDRRTMLFVFEDTEGPGGRAKWRYVTTGLKNDSVVAIVPNPETKMVQPGETVLVEGHYTLIHDALVRLVRDVDEAGGRPGG